MAPRPSCRLPTGPVAVQDASRGRTITQFVEWSSALDSKIVAMAAASQQQPGGAQHGSPMLKTSQRLGKAAASHDGCGGALPGQNAPSFLSDRSTTTLRASSKGVSDGRPRQTDARMGRVSGLPSAGVSVDSGALGKQAQAQRQQQMAAAQAASHEKVARKVLKPPQSASQETSVGRVAVLQTVVEAEQQTPL